MIPRKTTNKGCEMVCLLVTLAFILAGCEWSSGSPDGATREVIEFNSGSKAEPTNEKVTIEDVPPVTEHSEAELAAIQAPPVTPVTEVALEHFDEEFVDHVKVAEKMISAGNRAGAMLELGKALFDDNENYEAATLLGRTARLAGKASLAEKAFLAAVHIDADMSEPWIQLARLSLESKDLDLAEERAERGLVLDSESPRAHNLIGRIWLSRSHWHKAIRSLEKAVSLAPENRFYRNNLGFAYLMKRDYSRAIEHLEVAAGGERVEAYISNNLGLAYEGAGRLQDAIVVFKDVEEQNPGYVNAKINLERLMVLAKNTRLEEDVEPVEDTEELEESELIIPENEDF